MFNPNLLSETADPEGSVRYEDVNMLLLIIPCRETGVLCQWYKEDNIFIIYDCSPEYGNQAVDSFKGTLLVEANGSYSWWRSIDQRGNDENE
jgi:hypothetical protein